jgi:hypothetical protein
MSDLNINTFAKIEHVNARKEGPNDDKVLAIDVKLTGEVDHTAIAAVIGTDDVEEVRRSFWLDDEQHAPRFVNVDMVKVPSATEFKECDATFGNRYIKGVKVRKFSFTPRDRGVADITFTISVTDPPDGLMPFLAEQLGESMDVLARTAQQSFDFTGASND